MNIKLLTRIILNKGALWISYVKLIPILRKLDTGSIVLDCGANVGDITKKFAGTGATVYAFEPDPIAFGILNRRFKTNSNIILIQKGVWDKNADMALYSHTEQNEKEAAFTVSSSIVSTKQNVDVAKQQVIQVVDLSEFIKALGKRVTLIKLDVEGAEIEILKKIIATGTYKLFDAMYVETHETKIPGHKDELISIRALLRHHKISNIHLNWL